jgi:hypothetical protein
MGRQTILGMISLLMSVSLGASAQSKPDDLCQLSTVKDGQSVSLLGKVEDAAHDMVFLPTGCTEAVVLVYAGDPDSGESSDKLLKDKNLEHFHKYTRAAYGKIGRKGMCLQCPMYEVRATLTGRLNVAPDVVPEGLWKDKLGMLHDQTGKVVGEAGFGHPPIWKYRLAIESVSNVAAKKLPKLKTE